MKTIEETISFFEKLEHYARKRIEELKEAREALKFPANDPVEIYEEALKRCQSDADFDKQVAEWLKDYKRLLAREEAVKHVLKKVCAHGFLAFDRDSHARGEIYCSKPPQDYGNEPRCDFQCIDEIVAKLNSEV